MEKEQNSITIRIDNADPKEYLKDLHEAIAELKKLAFSHSSVELDKDECHAMFILSDFQIKLVASMST